MARDRSSPRQRAQARASVAQAAARLIVDHGFTDYGRAKRKAVEQMGLGQRALMPSNREIEAAVAEYTRLFAGDEDDQRRGGMLSAALRAMEMLSPFRPQLTGALLNGTGTTQSCIQLHVFTDTTEWVGHHLEQEQIPFRLGERRVRLRRDDWRQQPVYAFEMVNEEVEATVFSERLRGQRPLSPIDGRPVERASTSAVSAMLSDPRP